MTILSTIYNYDHEEADHTNKYILNIIDNATYNVLTIHHQGNSDYT